MDEVQGHPGRIAYEILEALVEARKGPNTKDSWQGIGKIGHWVQMLSQREPGSKNVPSPTLA
jgi:hypothetical protein